MRFRGTYFILIFLIALCNHTAAQTKKPADTSFTLQSAYLKTVKEFPGAQIVNQPVPPGVKILKNMAYYTSGDRILNLDLFLPPQKENQKYPLVIIIHGGGWRSGSREMEHQAALYLASHGIAAAPVEYMLSTEKPFPAPVHNIKCAIRWIKNKSGDYSLDSNNVFLMGGSAGGHLALLASVTTGIDFFETVDGIKLYGTGVKGIIDIDGVPDLTTPEESGKDTVDSKPSAVKQWLGEKYSENPELWRKASPVNYITKNSPPVLFINSSIPRFHAGRESVVSQLSRYKIRADVIELPETPHTFWLFNPWFSKVIPSVLQFINSLKD